MGRAGNLPGINLKYIPHDLVPRTLRLEVGILLGDLLSCVRLAAGHHHENRRAVIESIEICHQSSEIKKPGTPWVIADREPYCLSCTVAVGGLQPNPTRPSYP